MVKSALGKGSKQTLLPSFLTFPVPRAFRLQPSLLLLRPFKLRLLKLGSRAVLYLQLEPDSDHQPRSFPVLELGSPLEVRNAN